MPTTSSLDRWLPPFVSRLGLKIAAPVTLAAALGGIVVVAASLWHGLLLGLATGGVA